MKKITVKHRCITDCTHVLEFSEPSGDSSVVKIEFIDHSGGSAVEIEATENGYVLTYNGDCEISSLVNALEIFLKDLSKHYPFSDTHTVIDKE